MFAHRQSQEFTHHYRNQLEKQYSQPMTADVRKKIQNYSFLITDKIGKGYSSVVYKGANDLTGQTVAIKVIELKSLRDQTSKFMLQTEIQCFKETRHANLLRYENSFFTVNNCYIITEYCSRGDLAKLIKEKGGLRQEEAANMFFQIYEGYQNFYNAGFIHRDLKPANIFVAEDNSLKIADFGFSKRRNLVEKENYNVGTPIYMPKESLAANIYNEKTDVWALGITLYEMVFGFVPYRGKSEQDLRAEIERGILHFPDQKPISEDLKNFISSCLHNDSFRRISIREMRKHPWIQKLEKKLKFNLSQNQERVEPISEKTLKTQTEQKQMRISLPNDGVSHNKSKQYFEKLQNNLDNRRSISSMQKLKLCHPKKGSQILNLSRQPLVNRSVGSINLVPPAHRKQDSMNKEHYNKIYSRESSQNKENQPSNRPSLTVSTLPSTINLRAKVEDNKLEIERQSSTQCNNRLKVGIQKIVSLINYFRLLYKIIEKINQASQQVFDADIKTELFKLNAFIMGDLKKNFNLHLECLNTKSNLFNLNSQFWGEFSGSQRWQMYAFVIKKYQAKYETVIKSCESSCLDDSFSWKTYFIDFYGKLKEFQNAKILLVKERYALCELTYYLQTLVQMDDLIAQLGWEDFTQKYSNSDEFIQEGFAINMTNYYEIDQKVKTKFNCMKKRIN